MRLFSNRDRAVHLGRFPLERIPRMEAPPPLDGVRDAFPAPGATPLGRIVNEYIALFEQFRVESAAPELAPDDRRMWGLIHPALMGGEYLPRMGRDEVEIARISLESVTGDQISVRARRRSDRIVYSIVDEYEDQVGYELHPKTSSKPLSMRQLVELLDRACVRGGAVMSPVVWQIEDGLSSVDDMRGFVSVESDFYPDLGEYYAARFDRYFAEHAEEPEEESDS